MEAKELTFETTRFGTRTVTEDEIINFTKGLLGFEQFQRYCLISEDEYAPFLHLQSLDDPELAFMVVNPLIVFPHYKVEIDPREITELSVANVADVTIWGIVTVPDDVSRMSVNLQGPVLVNRTNNQAKQIVLVNSPYTTCHYIADELEKRSAKTSQGAVESVSA